MQVPIAGARIARTAGCVDNGQMTALPWQRRIQRAEELARQYSFAAEILDFYVNIARFQQDLYGRLGALFQSPADDLRHELNGTALSELSGRFETFLSLTEKHGPPAMAALSAELRSAGPGVWSELLSRSWSLRLSSQPQEFLAQLFLQPHAELLRSRTPCGTGRAAQALCPSCDRKPALGVLRQMGEGAARSLVCSFCVNEWEFRRLVCPACGEENDRKLPVYTADEFDYIRVESCETCKTYLKTIDLTKNGHAEPVVDELASIPLDLWAREQGYAKVQRNLLGM
jgi:FdhE protein